MAQYLKGCYKDDGDSLFTRNHLERRRGDVHRLLLRRMRLDTRFFTLEHVSTGIISTGKGWIP